MYNLEDLLSIYAVQNDITIDEAFEWYDHGRIPKVSLLEGFLEEEGLYGYTSTIWSIFEALR